MAALSSRYTPVRSLGGPIIGSLLPDRITRKCFSTGPGYGGGNAPNPVTRTATKDAWTSPCASSDVSKPWTGETWFFEVGCTNCVPPHHDESMTSDPVEGDSGETAVAASRVLKAILHGTRMGRWDLIDPAAALTSCLKKWTKGAMRPCSAWCATSIAPPPRPPLDTWETAL